MKDLVKLHQQKLSHSEAAPGFIGNVHVTRLKKGIWKRIPRLFNQKNGEFSAFLLMVKMDKQGLKEFYNRLRHDHIRGR